MTAENLVSIFLLITVICYAIIILFSLVISVCGANIFRKAKQKEINAYIPFLNLASILYVTRSSIFMAFLFVIPIVNLFMMSYVGNKLGRAFAVSKNLKRGLTYLTIFYIPALAFNEKLKYMMFDEEYLRQLDDASDESSNLLSQDEIDRANKEVIIEDYVDSIFKSDVEEKKAASPYKAYRKAKTDFKEDIVFYEIEDPKEVEIEKKSKKDIQMYEIVEKPKKKIIIEEAKPEEIKPKSVNKFIKNDDNLEDTKIEMIDLDL